MLAKAKFANRMQKFNYKQVIIMQMPDFIKYAPYISPVLTHGTEVSREWLFVPAWNPGF